MKTKIIPCKPERVISSGFVRSMDLKDQDAVLVINPDKFDLPPPGEVFEIVITIGEADG